MRNKITKLVFSLSIIWASMASFATAAELNCSNPVTQREMNQCAEVYFQAADGDLNEDYKMARSAMIDVDAQLPENLAGAEKALLNAQRAWIKFRDFSCAAEGYLFRGGSMEPLMVTTCKERLTRQRSEELRTLFEQN